MIGRVLRYARTTRHLRGEQLLAFIRARMRGRLRRPPPLRAATPSPALPALARELREWGYPWPEARREHLVTDARAERFTFAGITNDLRTADWRTTAGMPLWSYELHYLEALEALAWSGDAAGVTQLMRTWEANAIGGAGWDAYPVSARAAHWATALLLVGQQMGTDAFAHALSSLYTQLGYLAKNLETHLLGNHLLANRAALARGTLLFAEEPVLWRVEAHGRYQRELAGQVGPEGLHEERTPMYHALALRSALEEALLLRASGQRPGGGEMERIDRMLRADLLLRRADGSVRLLNDTAATETPTREYLERLGTRLLGQIAHVTVGTFVMRDAGYAGYRGHDAACVVDAGMASPPWQPGHAHCGALSYELDVGGSPLVVDSGVHGYDGDPFREYVRSTRAHNTVVIGGHEQGEPWATFRMARRWTVHEAHEIAAGTGAFAYRAVMSPYWSAAVRHTRDVKLGERTFSVNDLVTGAEGLPAESFVHLHPSCTAGVSENTATILREGREVARIEFSGTDRVSVVRGADAPKQGWYCETFGKAEAAPAVIARVNRLGPSQAFGYTIRWS